VFEHVCLELVLSMSGDCKSHVQQVIGEHARRREREREKAEVIKRQSERADQMDTQDVLDDDLQ
jgi:hypothetical protein